MTRDRQQTEQRLIDAVHELITTEGFDQVRINRLAQQAKVNKILIYRYFGGLSGLIEAYYAKYMPVSTDPLIDRSQLDGLSPEAFLKLCCDYLLNEFRELKTNSPAQQILKNDLLAYQPGAINPLMAGKEEQIQSLVDTMSRLVHPAHGRPLLAILVSAMTMLTFLAQDKRTLLGISLGDEKGWDQIERAVQYLYDGLAKLTETTDVPTTAAQPVSAGGQQTA
ncbi:transcriptional regulator, TetR family [Fibrella aestuarina BUZ 2]|uniref:Transcriptional regulator, TetR family n=1 Tax=Fibrella aestuarina BUZ 2 TaxID=1166018 RepID=I0K9E8_9BACT|nr:TetR/AcrR family transcriptional regulator [Fibrella aestuarina]CCH00751.1 transcriptional regulator, TetR family [Fibrella aestuarina BUZ 2]